MTASAKTKRTKSTVRSRIIALATHLDYAPVCLGCLFLQVIYLSACTTVPVQQEFAQNGIAVDTAYRANNVSGHLLYFNSHETGGRATGTIGFARAARYASERLASYGLQPIIQNEFSTFYGTSINLPGVAELRILARDTVRFVTGEGILPDARSGSDSLRFRTLVWNPSLDTDVRGKVVGLPESVRGNDIFLSLAERGARAVLSEGPFGIQPAARQIPGLVSVFIQSHALDRLTGSSRSRRAEIRLPDEAELKTTAVFVPVVSAMNVMAMLTGSDPLLRNELVVVSARLDGYGAIGNLQLTDGTDVGAGAAALLESARMITALQKWLRPLHRSVLFALWSGSMTENAGVKAFLEHPPWASEAVRAVVYLSDIGEDVTPVEQLVESYGITFVHVMSDNRVTPTDIQERSDLFRQDTREQVLEYASRLVRSGITTMFRYADDN